MVAEVIPMEVNQKKIGSQTPTKSLILPYDKSSGPEAIKIYEKSGRIAFDWQKFLTDAILTVNDESLWTLITFGFSLQRQNGKNEVLAIRVLYRMEKGERILHTENRTTKSDATFNLMLAI